MQFAAATWRRLHGPADPALAHPGDPAYPLPRPQLALLGFRRRALCPDPERLRGEPTAQDHDAASELVTELEAPALRRAGPRGHDADVSGGLGLSCSH